MDNIFKFSQVNDPTSFAPRAGTVFIAELCCTGNLSCDTDTQCVIHECDHLKLWMANNEVIRAETKGSRS